MTLRKKARFPFGQIVTTPGALEIIERYRIDPWCLLSRHVRGDWGDLTEEDQLENELSVREGFRILSAYGYEERRLWIVTEADRSYTTILRPDEY